MRFANPQLIWLLLVTVPLLAWFLWWAWRRKQALVAQFVQPAPRDHERVLRDVIRERSIAHACECHRVDRPLIALDDLSKGARVSAATCLDQPGVSTCLHVA